MLRKKTVVYGIQVQCYENIIKTTNSYATAIQKISPKCFSSVELAKKKK